MNAFAECIPCLLKLALTTARVAGCEESGRTKAVKVALDVLANCDLDRPPPMIAGDFLPLVNKALGIDDPFLKVKRDSNRIAGNICGRWAQGYIDNAASGSERLRRAVRTSIAGNIIDFAVVEGVSWQEKIPEMIETEFSIFELKELERALDMSGSILFLADNAGEIVFDSYLINEFVKRGKKVKVAVKGGPALNDALTEDAAMAGLGNTPGVEIITTGTAKMGVDLDRSSSEFLDALASADLTVSKGQANFESLCDSGKNIFFLTLIKCRALSEPTGIREGNAALVRAREDDAEYMKLASG